MQLEEIIGLMEKYTFNNTVDGELGEQDAAPASGGATTGGAYPAVTKWETGIARSVANTIDDKITWSSLYKTTRGKANTLL